MTSALDSFDKNKFNSEYSDFEIEAVKTEIEGFKLQIEKSELEKKALINENSKITSLLEDVNLTMKQMKEQKFDRKDI